LHFSDCWSVEEVFPSFFNGFRKPPRRPLRSNRSSLVKADLLFFLSLSRIACLLSPIGLLLKWGPLSTSSKRRFFFSFRPLLSLWSHRRLHPYPVLGSPSPRFLPRRSFEPCSALALVRQPCKSLTAESSVLVRFPSRSLRGGRHDAVPKVF